jgi:excinuclease ABC subunit A
VLADLATGAEAPVEVLAPLVRGAEGSHRTLIAHLAGVFPDGAIQVDGQPWRGGDLPPDQPSCGERLPSARPPDFHTATPDTACYRLDGRSLPELLALDVATARAALETTSLPPAAERARGAVRRRLSALAAVGLGYLPLDRPSPSLSRGEAQRVRIAVILASEVGDLLHILDEPTIGLDPDQVSGLMRQLGRLAGPVVLVEHDRAAVAAADHVIELGPGAGPQGGQVVFTGPPADLWRASTPSGVHLSRARRPPATAPARPGPGSGAGSPRAQPGGLRLPVPGRAAHRGRRTGAPPVEPAQYGRHRHRAELPPVRAARLRRGAAVPAVWW